MSALLGRVGVATGRSRECPGFLPGGDQDPLRLVACSVDRFVAFTARVADETGRLSLRFGLNEERLFGRPVHEGVRFGDDRGHDLAARLPHGSADLERGRSDGLAQRPGLGVRFSPPSGSVVGRTGPHLLGRRPGLLEDLLDLLSDAIQLGRQIDGPFETQFGHAGAQLVDLAFEGGDPLVGLRDVCIHLGAVVASADHGERVGRKVLGSRLVHAPRVTSVVVRPGY